MSRPQKSKRYRLINNKLKKYPKWNGYYMEDIQCCDCLYHKKKEGCPFAKCRFGDEKLDALENGRIKRTKEQRKEIGLG